MSVTLSPACRLHNRHVAALPPQPYTGMLRTRALQAACKEQQIIPDFCMQYVSPSHVKHGWLCPACHCQLCMPQGQLESIQAVLYAVCTHNVFSTPHTCHDAQLASYMDLVQGQLGMPTAANMNTLVQAYNGSYAGGQFGDQAGLLTSLGVSPALGGSLGLSNPMGNASFGSMQVG